MICRFVAIVNCMLSTSFAEEILQVFNYAATNPVSTALFGKRLDMVAFRQ
ncbi:MAG TPA: hypothetical protein VFD19_01860 [Clostridia bacterium]|nr:hypothetical protein [Clostridia bacterium]